MLCLHIPSFTGIVETMDTPAAVQTSAIFGIGLLYQGTAHRLMVEVSSKLDSF